MSQTSGPRRGANGYSPLLREGEADAKPIVGVGGGVGIGGDEGGVDLEIVVGAEGDGTTEGVVGCELQTLRHGAGGHLSVDVLDLADEGLCLAARVVETKGEVVAEVALLTHFEDFVEFSVLVTEADGELARVGLHDLVRGDVEVQIACLLILQASSDVVDEHGIDADEGREALGDVDRRDVVRRGRTWGVRLRIFDVAMIATDAHPGEVGEGVAHAVDAAVLVAEGHRLEMFADEG